MQHCLTAPRETEANVSDIRITGLVTNVQRFSIHDGPGIRTTVFLKGCSLRCFWCHNPEALSPVPEVQWFSDRCIGCDACIRVCPHQAHMRRDGTRCQRQRFYLRDRCQGCGRCTEACYADALVMAGHAWAADEIVNLLLRDREFYERSGGGITLSGGEPALQADFSKAVLEQCRRAGLHTAIETAAHCSWECLEAMLLALDLVILDLKCIDTSAHQAATGVRNHLILENARRLGETCVPLIVRTPVVPSFNDTADAIGAVAEFVRRLPNLIEYELMPFHSLAKVKYASLGLEYKVDHLQPPGAEALDLLAGAARTAGLTHVKIG